MGGRRWREIVSGLKWALSDSGTAPPHIASAIGTSEVCSSWSNLRQEASSSY